MIVIPGFDTLIEEKNPRYALWFYRKYTTDFGFVYPICSNCNELFINKPTCYCPECGAVMLNKEEAEQHYEESLLQLKIENEAEGKRNV